MIIKTELEAIGKFLQDAVDDGSRMAYVRIFRRKRKGSKVWEWCIDAQRLNPKEDDDMEGVMGVSSLNGNWDTVDDATYNKARTLQVNPSELKEEEDVFADFL